MMLHDNGRTFVFVSLTTGCKDSSELNIFFFNESYDFSFSKPDCYLVFYKQV